MYVSGNFVGQRLPCKRQDEAKIRQRRRAHNVVTTSVQLIL